MKIYTDTFKTPVGLFSVGVNEINAVVATTFGDASSLRTRLAQCHLLGDIDRTAEVRRQVREYFSGQRSNFQLKLALQGTSFQKLVWKALQRIPFGKTVSYGAIAMRIKRPKAARAVGRANGANPICLIVPCHRVIGANGSLTGFAFGESIKQTLLEHEGSLRATAL